MSLKIAFLVPRVPPSIDGVGEYTFHLARQLREKGVDAVIFTSLGEKAENPNDAWIYPVVRRWNGEGVAWALASLSDYRPDWCCLQFVPQLYHRYGISGEAAGIPAYLKRKMGAKMAVLMHEFLTALRWDPKGVFLGAIMEWQLRKIVKSSDRVITTCQRYVDSLTGRFGDILTVQLLPVGANVTVVPADKVGLASLRERWGLEGFKVLGMSGRLSAFRNFPTGLRSLKRMLEADCKVKLLLIGCVRSSHPQEFEKLMRLAEDLNVRDSVVETGDLSLSEMSWALQLVDLFLFPQLDGVSTRNTTVISAMAHGLPVLSYRPRQGNFDGYEIPCGEWVPQGKEESYLGSAVSWIKEDRTDPLMKEKNRRYYNEHFAWPVLAGKFLKALE